MSSDGGSVSIISSSDGGSGCSSGSGVKLQTQFRLFFRTWPLLLLLLQFIFPPLCLQTRPGRPRSLTSLGPTPSAHSRPTTSLAAQSHSRREEREHNLGPPIPVARHGLAGVFLGGGLPRPPGGAGKAPPGVPGRDGRAEFCAQGGPHRSQHEYHRHRHG